MLSDELESEQLAFSNLVNIAETVRRVFKERDAYRDALRKIVDRESMAGLTMDEQYDRIMEIASKALV